MTESYTQLNADFSAHNGMNISYNARVASVSDPDLQGPTLIWLSRTRIRFGNTDPEYNFSKTLFTSLAEYMKKRLKGTVRPDWI